MATDRTQWFVSAVSKEFSDERKTIKNVLEASDVLVVTQEDGFAASGNMTLSDILAYLKDCPIVLHLIGAKTGSTASRVEVDLLLNNNPELSAKLDFLGDNRYSVSRTQWEAYLAHALCKRLFVFRERKTAIAATEDAIKSSPPGSQLWHIGMLRSIKRDYGSLNFHSIDRLINKFHSLVRKELVKAEINKRDRDLSKILYEPPRIDGFVGRTNDLTRLREELEQTQVITLNAFTGQGKTWVLTKLVQDGITQGTYDKNGFFYFDCKESMKGRAAGSRLAEFLGTFFHRNIGPGDPSVIALASDHRSIFDRSEAAVRLLASTASVMFLDNFQDTLDAEGRIESAELRDFLVPILSKSIGRSRVLLACFENWPTPERTHVVQIGLEGLSYTDCKVLLKGVDRKLIKNAHAVVHGHPQAMLWFGKVAELMHDDVGSVIDAVRKDLEAEQEPALLAKRFERLVAEHLLGPLFQRLSEPAQRYIVGTATYRRPVSHQGAAAACGLMGDAADEARAEAMTYFMVSASSRSGLHSVHPLVRFFVNNYCREVVDRCRSYNAAAAVWLDKDVDAGNRLLADVERHYHIKSAGDIESAETLARELGSKLRDAGKKAWAENLADDAVRYADGLAKLGDETGIAHFSRAETLLKQDRTEEAREAYERAIASPQPHPAAFNQLGRLLTNIDPDKAQTIFEEGVTRFDRNPYLRNEYARFLISQKRPLEAEDQFKAGITADESNVVLRNEYARFLISQKRPLEAEDQFEAGIAADRSNAPLRNEYARFLISQKRPLEAEDQFEAGIAADRSNAPLRNQYARFLITQKRPLEAEDQFKAGIAADESNVVLRNEYARFLITQKRPLEAEAQFKVGIESDPSHAPLRNEYARFLITQKRPKEAEEQFKAGIAADPSMPHLRNEYARFLIQQHRPVEAEAQFKAGIEADPSMPHLRNEYARFLIQQDRPVEAEAQFKAGIEADPSNAPLRNEYSRFLIQQDRPVEAEAQFKAGIEADPSNAPLRNEYARFLIQQDRPVEAEAQFKAGIEADPSAAPLRNEYGKFLREQNRNEEAIAQLSASLKLDAGQEGIRTLFIQWTNRRPKYKAERRKAIVDGLQLNPNNHVFHTSRARIAMDELDYKLACHHIQEGLRAAPGNRQLLDQLTRLHTYGYYCADPHAPSE